MPLLPLLPLRAHAARLGRWIERVAEPGARPRQSMMRTDSILPDRRGYASALEGLRTEMWPLWLGGLNAAVHLRQNDLGRGQRYLSIWTPDWFELRSRLAARGIQFHEVGPITRIYLGRGGAIPHVREHPEALPHLQLYIATPHEGPQTTEVRRALAKALTILTGRLPRHDRPGPCFDHSAMQIEADVRFRNAEVRITFAPEDIAEARARFADTHLPLDSRPARIAVSQRWDGDTLVVGAVRASSVRQGEDRFQRRRGGSFP